MKQTNNHYELPFDQFSRQEIVRHIVDDILRPYIKSVHNQNELTIIDLGGHKGFTRDFFPNDDVTILDVFDEQYPGYIKGDATNMPFADDAFDVVVSFDTLEHIPADARSRFIEEAARVAKFAFILAAPFDNTDRTVSAAEEYANGLYKSLRGADHPWLQEHIENGLPLQHKIEQYMTDVSVYYAKLPSNNLNLWLLTQGLMFNSSLLQGDVKEVVDVSRFYNYHLAALEGAMGATYRHIYTGSRDKDLIDSVVKHMRLDVEEKNVRATEVQYVDAINKAYAAIISRLYKDREYLLAREAHLQSMHDSAVREKESIEQENNELRLRTHKAEHSLQQAIKRLGNKLHHRDS